MKPKRFRIVAVLLMLTAAGCSAKSNKSLVEGAVKLDGQPIAKGTIQFFPVDGVGQTAGASIVDGHYQIQSSPGKMRVVISAPKVVSQRKAYDTPDSPTIDQVQEQLPERYSSMTKSELTTTVEEGKTKQADFELTGGGEKPPPPIF